MTASLTPYWKHAHYLDELSGPYGAVRWLCSCGASGTERRHDLAGEAYRAHLTEAEKS